MPTLFDIFRYKNLKYDEITNEFDKKIFEAYINKIKGTEIERELLKVLMEKHTI